MLEGFYSIIFFYNISSIMQPHISDKLAGKTLIIYTTLFSANMVLVTLDIIGIV